LNRSSTTTVRPAPPVAAAAPGDRRRLLAAVGVVSVLVGIALRWWPRSALWLDEAQSVAFARLPLDQIPDALRTDGAPPAYYMLLHLWIRAFGDGDVAVRSLSALLSTLTLVIVWFLVSRRCGRRVAIAATALLALNPFAIRYASETRMYALVMLEVVVGLAAVAWALERPRLARLAVVTVLSGLLLYTHYWAIYLVIAVVGGLLLAGGARRRSARRVAVAVAAGVVLWLPWVPTFRFQADHTATPWAAEASAFAALQVFTGSVGAPTLLVGLYGVAMAGAFLAAFTLRLPRRRQPITPTGLAAVAGGTAAVGVLGAITSSSAVSNRYFAVAIPLIVISAGVGVWRMAGRDLWLAVLVFGVAGTILAVVDVRTARTTAPAVVAELRARAQPGDLLIYCPDQLAPATDRLLRRDGPALVESVFPAGSTPARVDWVDYEDRAVAADPRATAHAALEAAGDHDIWLVVSTTYPPTEEACQGLLDALMGSRRPTLRFLPDRHDLVEHGALYRFPPGYDVSVMQ
jgi:mannosyltransferase